MLSLVAMIVGDLEYPAAGARSWSDWRMLLLQMTAVVPLGLPLKLVLGWNALRLPLNPTTNYFPRQLAAFLVVWGANIPLEE